MLGGISRNCLIIKSLIMKNQILKAIFAILFLVLLSGFSLVQSQTLSVYVTDNGTPPPTSGDYYELFWEVVRFSGGSPVETYTCSPNDDIAYHPVFWPVDETVSCSLPDYETKVFKVHVDVKRRDSEDEVIAGGRGLSVYMNTYEVLNTSYSVYVTITNP